MGSPHIVAQQSFAFAFPVAILVGLLFGFLGAINAVFSTLLMPYNPLYHRLCHCDTCFFCL